MLSASDISELILYQHDCPRYRPDGRQSFGGGVLADGSLARFIYVDEAGTSAGEAVTVVAGVFVHPDEQWGEAKAYLDRLREEVPEEIRQCYVFHAKDIYSGGKIFKRKKWGKPVRWPILEKLLACPRACGLPVVFSYQRPFEDAELDPMDEIRTRHEVAFACMLRTANVGMKEMYKGERAALIAEDHRDMRQRLRLLPEKLRRTNNPKFVGAHPFEQIVDTIHFTPADGAPLLQIADAVAFALRHFFSGHKDGPWLMQHLTGVQDPTPLADGPDHVGREMILKWPNA